MEELAQSLQLTGKAINAWKAGDERYSHLVETEIQQVESALKTSTTWLETQRATLANLSRTANPPITVSQIQQQKHVKTFLFLTQFYF